MADLYEFPTDLPDAGDDGAATLRWTATVMAIAAAGLALLNPSAISFWLDDLPPGPVTVRLAALGEGWTDAMNRVGLGSGHARLHAAWKSAERTDWHGRQPVEMAATDGMATP